GIPFWTPAENGDAVNLTVEVTYVDDEAIAIVTRSSTQLREAIGTVTNLYAKVFAEIGLRINWKKGKSEAIVRCRGPGATKVVAELRSEGGLRIPLDDGTTAMHVVDGYHHLGGVISASGSMVPEARLLYNVAIWIMSPAALKQINGPYMRALRRIAGDMKAGHAPAFSDLAVIVDLNLLRRLAPELDAVPGCTEAPSMWKSRMRENDWTSIVQRVFFCESSLDKVAVQGCHAPPGVRFRRDRCDASFPTNKALLQHKRIAHKQTAPIKAFIDDSGACPACKTDFLERHRVIRHVSDSRRPACRTQIMSTLPAQSPELVAAWEARDNERVRLARRAGSTHILAAGQAVTAA
ncbi:unnamed protein product, partial [Prorocentrum cordatum]